MKANHIDMLHWAEETAKTFSKEEIEKLFHISLKADTTLGSNKTPMKVYNVYQDEKLIFEHANNNEIEKMLLHFTTFLTLKLLSSAESEKNQPK